MYLIMPPRKAMSVPERKAVYMSALDEVRVKRGSTLISVAPFSMASVTYLKDGVVFSGVASHDEDAVAVFDIDPVIGHRTASERLCQSRNRGAVSDARLVFDIHQPQGTHEGLVEPALLVVHGGTAHRRNGRGAVDGLAFFIF
jgi:hypothetical protein